MDISYLFSIDPFLWIYAMLNTFYPKLFNYQVPILKNDKYFLKFYKRYGISELFMVNYRHDFIRKEFMP